MNKLMIFETRNEFENFITNNSGLPFEEALNASNNGVYGSVVLIKDTDEIYANNKLQDSNTSGDSNHSNYATKDELNLKLDKSEAESTYLGKEEKAASAVVADSSTKLTYARTLWGKVFNGEQDIDGDLIGVNGINMNGGILSGNQMYIGNSTTGLGSDYTGGLIYTYGDTPIQFYTWGEERMKVDSSGVFIGDMNVKESILGKINGDGTITKIVKVTALPDNPDANTLYVIVE